MFYSLRMSDFETTIRSLLPEEQVPGFVAARDAYLRSAFDEALGRNQQLLAWAEEQAHQQGRILGNRFVGLCALRLDRLQMASEHLRRALDLAEASSCEAQVLLCRMHLGETLRRDGQMLAAYELFCTALAQAKLPAFLQERARLYGHYGSLLDQLGQRSAAAEVHGRMEELCELIGNPNRLANARGLVGRAAEFRGEREVAQHKYEDECRLAEQSGNEARLLTGKLHLALLYARKGERFVEAEKLCDEAFELARGHRRRQSEVWTCRAKICHLQGRLAASYTATQQATGLLDLDRHRLQHANHEHRLAELCRSCGLHGEALYHLLTVARIRGEVFVPLRQDAQVRKMAQSRIRELEGLARELVGEGRRVARTQAERDAIDDLVRRIVDEDGTGHGDAQRVAELVEASTENLTHGRDGVAEAAEDLWGRKLLAGSFEQLGSSSQKDLRCAELLYSAMVNDLAGCAFLFAKIVERELRKRVMLPALAAVTVDVDTAFRWRTAGLGKILNCLHSVANNSSFSGPERPLREHLVSKLAPYMHNVRKILRLRDAIHCMDGTSLCLADLRNAIAHGDVDEKFPNLSRLTVDAIKRTLVLEGEPSILAHITSIPSSTV